MTLGSAKDFSYYSSSDSLCLLLLYSLFIKNNIFLALTIINIATRLNYAKFRLNIARTFTFIILFI